MGESISKNHSEYKRDLIKHAGYIQKFSFKRGISKKRYFTLKDSSFSYSKEKGEPTLHQVKIDSSFKILSEDFPNKEISIECTNQRGEQTLWKLSFSSKKETEKWLSKLKKAIRPIWDKPGTSHCIICQKSFKVFRRQHHCRKCGHVMCAKHTKKLKNLQELGYTHKVKVCTNCADQLQSPTKIKRSRSLSMKESEKQEFTENFIRAFQSRSVLE